MGRMWRLVFQSIVSANTTTVCLNQAECRGRGWRDLVKIPDQRCPQFSKTQPQRHVIVTAGHWKPLVPISVICRNVKLLPLLGDVHLLIRKLGWNNKVKWGRGGLGIRSSPLATVVNLWLNQHPQEALIVLSSVMLSRVSIVRAGEAVINTFHDEAPTRRNKGPSQRSQVTEFSGETNNLPSQPLFNFSPLLCAPSSN